jgi:aromatic ring-opening dioxygenase catalytic subunit (LigB family)
MTTSRLPVLFVSHGGGPWTHVDELRRQYPITEQTLRGLPQRLPTRPKAVLVVSGHWEAPTFSVATHSRPPMEYDYSGFPPHTYQISYPAPGEPRLADRVLDLLALGRIEATPDGHRGFDHGVFVPLELMYPQADMPILMVSVKSSYNPAEHLDLGGALGPLRDEGVLIVGSGLTYHNMRGFGRPEATAIAEAFTGYLNDAVEQEISLERNDRLIRWQSAPGARQAHPREDHLMPLLVAAGAAGADRGAVLFAEQVMRVPMTSYVFGNINPTRLT